MKISKIIYLKYLLIKNEKEGKENKNKHNDFINDFFL